MDTGSNWRRSSGMGIKAPPMVTVGSNVFVKSFPRYLCLRLHQSGICTIAYSNLIWEETERTLRNPKEFPDMTDTRIVEIIKDVKSSIGEGVDLALAKHDREIKQLHLPDRGDRHVLYLASITDSRYLVTYNLKHFQQKDISHEANKWLRFQSGFEVAHFDRFLCTLIAEQEQEQGHCDDFLVAVARTIAPMTKIR